MMATILSVVFTVLLQILAYASEQTHIGLKQGALFGLKVFPDSSHTAVYAFLGVPYAQSPVGELRFAPPKPHKGWNSTLQTMNMKPVCPQLSNTIYDEAPEELPARPAELDEDCLYLNIWVSENGLRYGGLPVLVVLTGEDMSYDWPRNRVTGLDMAVEGLVVITVQYRTNIFGWINVREISDLNGNYGMQDQALALQWIQENIKSFGGSPQKVTLLGHGSSGGPCAFLHFLNHRLFHQNSGPLFSQLILMSSGDIEKSLTSPNLVQDASKLVIQKLGCHFEENSLQVLTCLQSKSISDLLKAFEAIYDHGNGTYHLGPSISFNLTAALRNFFIMDQLPNTMVGISSNEGAFLRDIWLELARNNYESLRSYVNYTLLKNIVNTSKAFNSDRVLSSLKAINWRFFNSDLDQDSIRVLASIQRFLSEYEYEIPFYNFLKQIASAKHINRIYAYNFHFSNTIDMRGKLNVFGGASHTSDLPMLFGPTLFQQIARRRLTIDEQTISRKMRTPVINFIKTGNPNPSRLPHGWQPYTNENNFIFDLGEKWTVVNYNDPLLKAKNFEKAEQLLSKEKTFPSHASFNRNVVNNQYQMSNAKETTNNAIVKRNSDYALHLQRVYSYWHIFLPQTFCSSNCNFTDDIFAQRILYMEVSANAARYKHGFFVMLSLVLVLMALLGLCIYLLKRDPLATAEHIDCSL